MRVNVIPEEKTISPPKISLPKGGGAIRGIGEKFAANPVMGTGSLNVPIFTSPSRSGFGPQLSLSYDSGTGNGPFGFGWGLLLPSITRKTEKGLPKYQDAEESDTFILSSAEDLVPALTKRDGQWEREQFDRTLPDGNTFNIQRYRPRIEGLFARIERWTNKKDNDIHWRSISKDNITTIYGLTNNARITDPTDKSRIFSWLICESYDDKGNAIYYEYKAENSQRIKASIMHERNRNDLTRSANRYLKRIKYCNKTPHQLNEDLTQRNDWLFEVVFDYGEHYTEDEQGQPSIFFENNLREWDIRLDPFSSYRAGFEIRSYRLCQRVLMFHHFPEELGVQNYLVRATRFTYTQSPIASFIKKITQSGYQRNSNGIYLNKSLPPLEFEYSSANIQEEVKEIDPTSLENLPIGLDGTKYRWVDIDGEGLSGILTEQEEGWFYKRNLSGLPSKGDDGKSIFVARFAPMEQIATIPSTADLSSGEQQLLDLAGDGQLDLVNFSNSLPGFFERTHDERWDSFKPFDSFPNLSWNNPNLKFVDLTGDGHADIFITEDQAFTWYPSLGESGFGLAEKVIHSIDEETGPKLIFADGTQSIYLADLSGDGLIDLVRILNGEVSYWPNLGYGHFGAKISMDNAPWFDHPEQFSQQRIRLADIDGSGTTDIIYLGINGIQLYFNQSGNRWSEVETITQFPQIDNLSAVLVIDLLGNGTACIVWSTKLPGKIKQQMQYIDLMGGQKPHLLINLKNNLGAETRIHYASSTKFYLIDKTARKPWITRLPFPVHVVERVETYDYISRNRFVTRYAYHHGYFDGTEREFRGFGMVEQWDTEEIGTPEYEVIGSENMNWDTNSFVPPVLTRSWFHTGAFFEDGRISKQFLKEYYLEGHPNLDNGRLTEEFLQTMLLPDTVIPNNITVEETREAYRSLKGGILRKEIYALDRYLDGSLTEESSCPYTVSEHNYTIKCLQPQKGNIYAVFLIHPRETINFHYEREIINLGERNLFDPRVTHLITLNVDDFGNVNRSVTISYPRRALPDLKPEQKKIHITFTVNRYINCPENEDWYRVGLPAETRTYEIVKPPEPIISVTSVKLFKFEEIQILTENLFKLNQDDPDTSKLLPYEKWDWRKNTDIANKMMLRLIENVRTYYRKNDLTGFLPLGKIESLALPGETYKLALTPGLLTTIYQRQSIERGLEKLIPNPPAILRSKAPDGGGYIDLDDTGYWWVPSGKIFYSHNPADTPSIEFSFAQKHFFLQQRFHDAFDQVTKVCYDEYDLLLLESVDPLCNKITAGERDMDGNIINKNNYRVLQPMLLTDPNNAINEVLFDVIGLVVATSIHKGDLGDSLHNANVNLNQIQIDGFFANPKEQAFDRLGTATTCIVYDMNRYHRNKDPDKPPYIATIVRESHEQDLVNTHTFKVQIRFSYSDGFGREIQKKIQAEPGPIRNLGEYINPRWVGSGWKTFNNKGKIIREYEPFFDNTHEFKFGIEKGVSKILFYDPVGRVIATLHPNNTYEKVVFDPWCQITYDINDTVTSDPRTDEDIHDYVAKFFSSQSVSWKTWYNQRIDGSYGLDEKDAAIKAKIHANTPNLTYYDTIGRPYLKILHNRINDIDEFYQTQYELDIEGNQRIIIDAKERIINCRDYDMLGNQIKQLNMEGGTRWFLKNSVGNSIIRIWDSRGFQRRMTYDTLQRPQGLYVTDVNGVEQLAEKMEYGESKPNPESTNHRLKVWKISDGAGILINDIFDFKGNLHLSKRQILHNYTSRVDWTQNPPLESEIFTSRTLYDALNRPIQSVYPYSSRNDKKINVTQLNYNEANLLEGIDLWLNLNTEPEGLLDSGTANHHIISEINYNEKGQQIFVEYGNGVRTKYEYDEQTFHLKHLFTTRGTNYPSDCSNPNPCNDPPKTCPKSLNFSCGLQNLHYTYDPIGNIISMNDYAQQTIFFNGQIVKPKVKYNYDALYRLIEVHGREHVGQVDLPETTWNDRLRSALEHPNDGQKMRNYTELYEYDEVGNILHFNHKAHNGNWIRTYEYNESSLIQTNKKNNYLSSTSVRGAIRRYKYDLNGNIIRMPHFTSYSEPDKPNMYWNFENQLEKIELKGGNTVYYTYDASGQRLRKVYEHAGNLIEERIYLGNYEIYRKKKTNQVVLERETLNIMDDKKRVALIEIRTIDTQHIERTPQQLVRYQHSNHLGSVNLELNDQSQILSYEEYYPYGSTSYQAVPNQVGTPKRYRYNGKERDEESGLYYYGARYYAPWLGRWTSSDPAGLIDGVNLYAFVKGNPVKLIDLAGNYSWGEFGSDVWAGIKGAGRGLIEPAVIVMDFGQMGAALVCHKWFPEKYHDVQWLSGFGKRLEQKPGGWQAARQGAVLALAIPTGGGTVLIDNIYTVFEDNLSPDQAQSMLVQGAVAQVALTGLAVGGSKLSGRGWTGRAIPQVTKPITNTGTTPKGKALLVGPERTAEFQRGMDYKAKGYDVTAVNPKKTAAAENFIKRGGIFEERTIQELDPNLRFNIIEEQFPQPYGRTLFTLEQAISRFQRLPPGGRLRILTENPDLVEIYRGEALTRKMSFQVQEIPANSVELPPYLIGEVGNVFSIEITSPSK